MSTAANYHVLSIVETCSRLGLDKEQLLKQAGIASNALEEPYERQPGHRVLALWDVAQELLKDPLVPLHVGLQGSSMHRSVITTLIEASKTLGEALELGVRYQHLTQDIVKTSLHWDTQCGYMEVLSNSEHALPIRPQIERQIAFVIAEARNLSAEPLESLGRIEAHFTFPAQAPEMDYEAVLGFPVRFRQDRNQLVFEKRVLDARNFCSSDAITQSLMDFVETQDRALTRQETLTHRLRRLILEALGKEHVDVALLAPRLNMSVRTLQRKLKAENTSFFEVYDEVRRDRALHLMASEKWNVSEVAYRVGFNHITSFYTAFHRWTGEAPKAYQKHK